MYSRRWFRFAGIIGYAVAALLGVAALANWAHAAESLPAFGADSKQTTMSGLSSGAYMTAQFQVAYSGSLAGAGVMAGGPFYCAEGNAVLAALRCMQTTSGAPDPQHLLDIARQAQAAGKIDDLANLASQRVYIFGSLKDPVVTSPVIKSLSAFYRLAGVPDGNIMVEINTEAGHAFLTQDSGNACGVTAPPFINNCGKDQAGLVLTSLYGPLSPPVANSPTGHIVAFNQAEFLASPRQHGLDDEGYLYVPPGCEKADGKCRLHVALHGCLQGRESVGDLYYTSTGYNRWADANGILVLYPQAVKTPKNPQGCWDWFGYDDPAYYTKSGRQMAAIKAMIDRILAERDK